MKKNSRPTAGEALVKGTPCRLRTKSVSSIACESMLLHEPDVYRASAHSFSARFPCAPACLKFLYIQLACLRV